jgi:hypothetical protein
MPWLGRGFVHCVHEDALDALRRDLAGHGFNVVSVDGTAMMDAPSFHAEAKRAFGFPDFYGSNWDAFNDCLSELRLCFIRQRLCGRRLSVWPRPTSSRFRRPSPSSAGTEISMDSPASRSAEQRRFQPRAGAWCGYAGLPVIERGGN